MADSPFPLYAVPFTKAEQERLTDFTCGDESWSRHVTEWIRGSDVFDSMRRGTQVWVFETHEGEIVGFGSIGTSTWRWPPPDGQRSTVVLIPMVGIDTRFQGQPRDPVWRYSRQIVSHLIDAGRHIANQWTSDLHMRPEWLVLMVHKDNARAIRFYEQIGFSIIPGVLRRGDHLVMKVWLRA